ncbi:MAG: YitT family protein [Thermodesulfobacteriota bacterium]|nr:YitT family protein [Thermodesulfobacteriota bacterium]
MSAKKREVFFSVARNLILLTTGAVVLAIGIKAIAIPHGFITGGFSGLSLLIYYVFGGLSPGIWYFVLNIPLFIAGWIFLSRRFFFYSLFGAVVLAVAIDLIPFAIPIHDKLLAALAAGTLIGAGAGTYLHSFGSAGGTDIIAIILNQKFNIRIGRFYFYFNLALFSLSFGFLDIDIILFSLILSFIVSQVTDYFLSMFNQRKMVIIISDRPDSIAEAIFEKLSRGSTYLFGRGAYTGRRKKVIMTVVNNYQLKRLEEAVFNIDSGAFFITENTFNVIGKGFSRRRQY